MRTHGLMNRLLCALFFILSTVFVNAAELSRMRVAVLGDSMTWIGGDSCENDRGWTHHFVNLASPHAVDVYARSGATWTNTSATVPDTEDYSEVLSDRNVIYNQALRLVTTARADADSCPDMVIIYAGANDVWFSDRRPGIFNDDAKIPEAGAHPSEVTSLAGSVALVCKMLKKEFPETPILLMTPVEMSKAPAAVTAKVSSIIAETAAQMGVDVVRTDREVPIRHIKEARRPELTTDGVHTSPAGALLIGSFIARYLKSGYQAEEK